MFLLTYRYVGFLSAKVLLCNGLKGERAYSWICVNVSNLMGALWTGGI